MAVENFEDDSRYEVVVNHEEQYSIWPEGREVPLGWRLAGKAGTKAECLAYVEQVWTDMRPLSLREQMKKLAENPQPEGVPAFSRPPDPRDDLVAFLSEGDHPVQASAKSVEHFLERIKAGYVNIKFTDTRGGTELGVRLDSAASDTTAADIEGHKGNVRIAGNLTLNYQPVRLVAEVALETLMGSGRLQLQESTA
jgi:uncharacterized protein YbdZ (MbtH family)